MILVIVESPTKAKTISKFLGKDYKIVSSYGHVRDLPKGQMGIDIENNFQPHYVVPVRAKKIVKDLKSKMKGAQKIILATDEDREGEAIAWHLAQALDLQSAKRASTKKQNKKTASASRLIDVQRIAFHEITKTAIEEALKNPRAINMNLVDSQQARRILDRLVGYELSPLLWRKITKKLSAGRVQSVTVRLVVEREKEIKKFALEEYWSIEASLNKKDSAKKDDEFIAKLSKINNKSLGKLDIKTNNQAQEIASDLSKATYQVSQIEKKETKKNPLPPFTTSTLQQEAWQRLNFPAKLTMGLAQALYEQGYITYHRTDSLNLAEQSLWAAKQFIEENYGSQYWAGYLVKYKTKAKAAQEAHEAVRPTYPQNTPEELNKKLDKNQAKLYDLIWRRFIACQMKPIVLDSTNVQIKAGLEGKNYQMTANGSIIKFDGFLKIYRLKISENILPQLEKNEGLKLIELKSNQHFTQPPSRYSEASLIKKLEEYGIGRPSTYAPIISTIQERGYIKKETGRLFPTEIAFLVTDLLTQHFPQIVDYQFTAKMEENLDKIAQAEVTWQPVISDFYQPFKKILLEKDKTLSKEEILNNGEKILEKCPDCGADLVLRMSRFGRFLACANFPKCRFTKNLGDENGKKENSAETEEMNVVCEQCGGQMKVKNGPYGKFLGCSNYPTCKNIKSLSQSLGINCPACGQGEMVEKRTKRKRIFYACNRWPQCKFALWQKPVAATDKTIKKCPNCSSPLVYNKDKITCSNKECPYQE